MNKEIKVFIADDHPIFLSGLRMLISSDARLQIVGEAVTGHEALAKIQSLQPNVAVLDLSMPEKNGIEIVRELHDKNIDIPIIFLTMHDEEATLNSALDLGIKGYILKDSAMAEILTAIKAVAGGKIFITSKLSGFLVSRNQNAKSFAPNLESLSSTELTVLRLISNHKSSKEIAAALFVSRRTIDQHRYNICHKLKISGINSLLKFAIENKSKLN